MRGAEDITPVFESYHALAHSASIRQSLEKFEWVGEVREEREKEREERGRELGREAIISLTKSTYSSTQRFRRPPAFTRLAWFTLACPASPANHTELLL